MLTVGIFAVESTRYNLRNAVFTVNIKLCRKRWQWPFSTRKVMGKLNKTISKLSAALSPVYIHNTTNSNGSSSIATNCLPSNGKNKRRRRCRLKLCWRQLFNRQKQTSNGSKRARFLLIALGARRGRRFHATNSFPSRKRRRKR